VVLDPPKLIRSRREQEQGARKYFDLNRLALPMVKPGGIMLSCSCSGLMPEAEFVSTIASAARQCGPPGPEDANGKARRTGRPVQFLAKSGASADHPVSSNCPEGEYLKAVWMRVG
jgi:23S rRNA (cytosine1962-C5)-methyltransferase